tara:strand:- start:21 stop:257 length:237 start_codon:yes stop_codon:yes gene_type:complete
MAFCDKCGNFDKSYAESFELTQEQIKKSNAPYYPDLYYYWDSPIEEDYDWRESLPNADCLCEICFDILNSENKIKWSV